MTETSKPSRLIPTDISSADDCCKQADGKLCAKHARSVLPQLAQPWWYRDVKTGDANRSDEHPDLVRRRQRNEREIKLRRAIRRGGASRLAVAVTGARTGRNRKAA